MLKTSDFVEVGPLQIEDVGRLTKREMIAAMAMQGILADAGLRSGAPLEVAKFSAMYADALMRVLGESHE